MTEQLNTLTPTQKDLYNFVIDIHRKITGGDATRDEAIELIDYISEFDMLDATVVLIETGKFATKQQKFTLWFNQNIKEFERIFHLV